MEKIKIVQINSANIKVDNLNDTEREYSISSNIDVGMNNSDISFDSGEVKQEEVTIATFNMWGTNNLNISYTNTPVDKRCNILEAVNVFMEDSKEFIKTQGVSNILNL